jgi:hypothetical protein
MLTFISVILGILVSRALWHFVVTRAEAMDISPLRWLIEFTACVVALSAIAAIFVGAVIFLLYGRPQ